MLLKNEQLIDKKFDLSDLFIATTATQTDIKYLGLFDYKLGYQDSKVKFFIKNGNDYISVLENEKYPVSNVNNCFDLVGKRVIKDNSIVKFCDRFPKTSKILIANGADSVEYSTVLMWEKQMNGDYGLLNNQDVEPELGK